VPELPEIETIRSALALHIPGRRVVDVLGEHLMMRRPLEPASIRKHIIGRSFTTPRRRGKYLLLDLDTGEGALLVHLGMSGRVLLANTGAVSPPHTHLTLRLEDKVELRLVDPRRFGFASWVRRSDETNDPSLRTLGPEPLELDITRWLPPILKRRRGPLKALLLDQRIVAGIGNIYATEALFRASIRPDRAGRRTSMSRLERLARVVREVLLEAIKEGGTTLRDYMTPAGDSGYFKVRLEAYGRAGQPCTRCQTALRNDLIAGRSTMWCPRCQH